MFGRLSRGRGGGLGCVCGRGLGGLLWVLGGVLWEPLFADLGIIDDALEGG